MKSDDWQGILAHAEALVALGPRETGTEAGRAAAEYVAATLKRAGVPDVDIERAASSRWTVSAAALEVAGRVTAARPVAHSAVAEGHLGTFGTGSSGVTARLADIDPETHGGELRGTIVMFDVRFAKQSASRLLDALQAEGSADARLAQLLTSLPDDELTDPYHSTLPAQVSKAQEAGAVGFIAVLHDYFDSHDFINEDFGSLSIPGMWITATEATAVRQHIASLDAPKATLRLEGAVVPAEAAAVIGVLPGRSAETLIIQSHHDSVWDGAVEDASGTAIVLALAEHFAARPRAERPRTLLFASMDTHFTGYEAHEHFVTNHVDSNRDGRDVLLAIGVEHIALDGRVVDGRLVVENQPSPRLIFSNVGTRLRERLDAAISDLPRIGVMPTSTLPTDELPTDLDYLYRAGVPVVSLISAPMYLYDRADTIDKIDRSQLVPVRDALIDFIDDAMRAAKDDFTIE